ncbi:MAG: hypothetical protein ACRD3B_00945 [Candidatus Sulfotelmatobacter sp.]
MLTNKLSPISRQPEPQPTDQVVREGLVKLAEVHRKNGAPYPLTSIMTQLWIEALADMDASLCDVAFRNLIKVGCRREFPIPADVRAQVDQAEAKGFELEAEQEWRKALLVATEFWHPDIGLYRNAPELSSATWHALNVAGGLPHLFNCSREELQWTRKRFIADYTLIHETGKVEHLLGDREATRILARLAAGTPKRKQIEVLLPADPREDFKNVIPREEVREVLERIMQPAAGEPPTEEEWQARKDRLKRTALEWAAQHGYSIPEQTTGRN